MNDQKFTDNLIDRIIKCRNYTVVGLDPRLEYVPGFIKEDTVKTMGITDTDYSKGVAEAFLRFNKEIIDAVYDIVPAVKPQIAFYEQYGIYGMECFMKTCRYAKEKGMAVIGDVKRGDIGSTAEAYSDFYLGAKGYSASTDCITVNPYLGTDSLTPFIKDCSRNGKGIFILVKTSNKSSVDIQDLIAGDKKVYEHVAEMVAKLGQEHMGSHGYSLVGAVVGATFKADAAKLRKMMKNSFFLVPGYGAQGGTASDVAECFNEDGLGAIVNSSRGIIAAYMSESFRCREEDFAKAAREAAISMRDDINNELKRQGKLAW